MSLGKSWAGQIYGTHIGKASAELTTVGANITGEIRANIEQESLVVLQAFGTFDGSTLTLQFKAIQLPTDAEEFDGSLSGVLQHDGNITGTWSTAAGGGGPFVLFPHPGITKREAPAGPSQIHSAAKDLGWIRLGKAEVVGILQLIDREFPLGTKIVTVESNGGERTFYGSDFATRTADISVSKILRISVQQQEAVGFNRTLNIDLGPNGNSVRVVSIDESWAVGLAHTVHQKLKRGTMYSATWLQRTGLLLLIYLGLLLVMAPQLPLLPRSFFVGAVLAMLPLTGWAFTKFIPRVEVYPSRDHVPAMHRIGGAFGTIFIAAAGGLLATALWALLTAKPLTANDSGSLPSQIGQP